MWKIESTERRTLQKVLQKETKEKEKQKDEGKRGMKEKHYFLMLK